MNNIAHWWLESLPAAAVFALVMALSAVVATLSLRVRLRTVRWLALVTPFVIAWCIYWLPAWAGNDPSEYDAWAPLFIVPWGLSGAVASVLVFVAKRTMTRVRTR